MTRPPGRSRALPGSVRIIGGRWRGSRLPVGPALALRPSSDRVRETLFNWLSPTLPGARCLDLFAGTGVLGFEAVSRGAAQAVLVEQDTATAGTLDAQRVRLDASAIRVHRGDAFDFLAGAASAQDIVFIDPPFGAGLVARTLTALAPRWLAPDALVYVEIERGALALPAGWSVHRQGATRQVDYALVRWEG